ncbi:MAG: efflux RND transporter periplasmic adaptor subunit [Isosphaeraceae bacterium]
MRRALAPSNWNRDAARRWFVLGLLAALAAPGCGHETKIEFVTDSKPATVQVIQPQVRNIVRVVGQPSFIESYERTAIYSKPTAYIEKWIVDIGDKVKKGETLATLFVPELVEDHETKEASIVLDQERIMLAKEVVNVAKADVQAAEARLKEAHAILDKYEAEVERWDSEVTRLQHEVNRIVIDAQVLVESTHQLKSSAAARDKAKATIRRTEAELLSKRSMLSMAEVDVRVAEADLKVAESEARRLKAWVGYLTLSAPFTGVITARNANTFDFVLPSTGDPSANNRTPHLSPNGASAPIYVVDRTDIVRVFVDVPEQDANYVHIGSKAMVLAKAYRDEPIPAKVTRTSWALNTKSRTLRAEIDLPNPGSQLLPGMYAYAKVIIERPDVRALPASALAYSGEKAYYWTYDNGHAVRTEVQTGVGDGEWIEVTNRQLPTEVAGDGDTWVPIDGKEQVILGDMATLADGTPVEVAPVTGGTKLASSAPSPPVTEAGAGRPTNTPPAPIPVEASNVPIRKGESEF